MGAQIAMLRYFLGRYEEALPIIQRCVIGRENLYGIYAPETLSAIKWQAHILEGAHSFADAEPLYARVVDGIEKLYGAEHNQTVNARKALKLCRLRGEAQNLCATGNYADAEPVYLQAVEDSENLYAPTSPLHSTLAEISK